MSLNIALRHVTHSPRRPGRLSLLSRDQAPPATGPHPVVSKYLSRFRALCGLRNLARPGGGPRRHCDAARYSYLLVSAQLAAALVAAGSALLAVVMSTWTVALQRRQSARVAEIDFRRRQLNDLYGPIYMRLWTTFKLRALLPTVNADGTPWSLGDHIEQTQAGTDAALKDAFGEMLTIGEEVEQLLIGNSGLFIAFPPPPSYGQLIAYSRLLRLAWQNGKDQPALFLLLFFAMAIVAYGIVQLVNRAKPAQSA